MEAHDIDVRFLEQLSEKNKKCLLSRARTCHFDRGATISLQGETANCLKIVLSGWVKLYRVSKNGEEAVLATLHDGQSYDEIAALNSRLSPSSAEAVSDCTVLFVDLSCICSCQGAHLEITQAILTAASDHIETMMDDIETLKIRNGAERLTDYLLGLTSNTDGQNNFVLPFGKTVLAGKLGMKPESLSRAFARLKRFGVQSDKRHVSISDVSVLRSVSESARTAA